MSFVTLIYQDQQVRVPVPHNIEDLYNFACQRFGILSPCFTYRQLNSSCSLIKSQPDLDILLRVGHAGSVVIDVTDEFPEMQQSLKLLRFRKMDSVSTQKSHLDNSDSEDDLEMADSSDSVVIEHEYSQQTQDVSTGCEAMVDAQNETEELSLKENFTETNRMYADATTQWETDTPLALEPLVSKVQNLLHTALKGKVEVIHSNSLCSACRSGPIIGYLYQCVECVNAVFCSACEISHPHPLYVIRSTADSVLQKSRLSSQSMYDARMVKGLMDISEKSRRDAEAALTKSNGNFELALELLIGSN